MGRGWATRHPATDSKPRASCLLAASKVVQFHSLCPSRDWRLRARNARAWCVAAPLSHHVARMIITAECSFACPRPFALLRAHMDMA
eukprot:scaffold92835_cov66-Phaeocystis_antarctica.AAC.4